MLFSKIRLVSFIFLFFSFSTLYGQGWPREIRVGATVHKGFLWGHSFNAMHLGGHSTKGLELEVSKRAWGNWEFYDLYKNALAGVSFQAFLLDKEKRLGNQYAMLGFFQQESGIRKKLTFFYRIGGGLGYASRRFDLLENNTNNLISSHINFSLTAKTGVKVEIKRTILLSSGISLLHFSNGAYKMPNLGTNIPSVFFTAEYLAVRLTDPVIGWKENAFKAYSFIEASIKGGMKEGFPVNGPKFPIFVITGLAGRQINQKSSLNFGIDFQYDGSIKRQADTMGLGGGFNYTRTAITAGHELSLGRISILTQLGIYVIQPVPFYTKIYQRYGLKYYVKDDLFAQVTLKTHGGRADFVEWGLGIRLKKK